MVHKLLSWLLPVSTTDTLTNEQRKVVEYIDSKLTDTLPRPNDSMSLSVVSFIIPLKIFALGDGSPYIDKQLESIKGSYIPRSVAITNNGFAWNVYIGLRTNAASDETKALMFLDLLTRTNAGRVDK